MNRTEIQSFQWWLSNDKNVWTATFWNAKNIEYRKNSSYIELNKQAVDAFNTSNKKPVSLQYWYNWGTITTDLVAFCSDGSVYTSTWVQWTVTGWVVTTIEANSVKYIIWPQKLYSFDWISTYTLLETFTNSTTTRPVINFNGDLIIWDWNQVLRYNADWIMEEYVSGSNLQVIWDLDGNVQALTYVWSTVYVWCNDGMNTILYLWDWITWAISQTIRYTDKPVRNVALLWNQHIWWSNKSDSSIRQVMVGEWYSVQTYAKSDYPDYPITTDYNNDNNRLALADDTTASVNAIETIADIVYLPWIWSIYWFGKYYPSQNFSINREFAFTWTYVTCMTSGATTPSWYDAWWVLAFACLDGSTYKVKLINLWADGFAWLWVTYASEWEIESMEYLSPSFSVAENNKKMILSWYLPHSSTSIEVYYKMDRWSYTLAKTINTTDFWTGFKTTEIPIRWSWSTLQFKFKLKTTNNSYTPQLSMGIINLSETVWNSL